MASSPPTAAQVLAQMSTLVNSWQTYINQQVALDNGSATYIAYLADGVTVDPTQPAPGYYPITMPSGIIVWRPCLALIQATATSFIGVAHTGAGPFTLAAADAGKLHSFGNGSSTNGITVNLPNSPLFTQYVLMQSASAKVSPAAASGGSISNRQNYSGTAGLYANCLCLCVAVAANGGSTWAITGDLA